MIIISHPNSYEKERKYIYDVIFEHWLGLKYTLLTHAFDHTLIQSDGVCCDKQLLLTEKLFSTPRDKWLTKESLPKQPLKSIDISNTPFKGIVQNNILPIIYGDDLNSIIQKKKNIYVGFDLIGSIFFMITRYEEIVKATFDSHDRFYSKASLSHEEDFLHRAIANEYLEILWACLKSLWPHLERKKRSYKFFLTHDVDHPYSLRKKSFSGIMKTQLADIMKRKDLSLFAHRLKFYLTKDDTKYNFDPNNTFDFLMNTSEKNNIKSSFYFIAGNTAQDVDGFYNMDMPIIRNLMKQIHTRGHNIGLHPSYNTYISPESLNKEFQNLLRVANLEGIKQETWGGRQHYLRWKAPFTWQNWEDVGLNYDSTLSYADQAGFRCGTCYEFPVFNLMTSQKLKLIEYPLIVMETTLLGKNYQNQSLLTAFSSIKTLANTVKFFDGTFTLLWHNNALLSSRQKKIYESIIQDVAKN